MFKFIPLGLPSSASQAVSASAALRTDTYPQTASLAEFAIANYGPQGPPYKETYGTVQ